MPQAGETRGNPQSFRNAEASTTIKRGHAIKLGTNYNQAGNDALLNVAGTTRAVGICLDKDALAGEQLTAEISHGEIVIVRLGASLSRGALLVSDTDGDHIAASTGNLAHAILLEAGGDGDEREAIFCPNIIAP